MVMQMNNLLIGVPANPKGTDAGLLVLRVFAGLTLAFAHGWGKVPPQPGFIGAVQGMGLPAPEAFAWLAAAAEFGGGLLLAVGLLTRPAALLVVGHFTIVVLLAHAGDPFDARELALFFGVVAFFLLLAGPGRYSLDGVLKRRSERRPTAVSQPAQTPIAEPPRRPQPTASREIRVQRRSRSSRRAPS
jgi:putative oxidoreductase